jgi:hypothetical protein
MATFQLSSVHVCIFKIDQGQYYLIQMYQSAYTGGHSRAASDRGGMEIKKLVDSVKAGG